MIAAIAACGLRFMTFRKVAGTSAATFLAFVIQLMNILPPGQRFCFLYDNLKSHLTNAVMTAITARGHMVAPRPAYYPVDGPIEYFFNQIEQALSQLQYEIRSEADLVRAVRVIFNNIQNVDRTFRHCGYPVGLNDPVRTF